MTPQLLSGIFCALLAAAVGQATPMPTTLRLRRNTLRIKETGRPKNFYSASVRVGQPAQEFHVAFDLGGGTTVLPSASCRDAACLDRRRYDKDASDTAQDIQADGSLVDPDGKKVRERAHGREVGTLDFLSADLGQGGVKGNFVRDRICVGDDQEKDSEARCFPLALLVAFKMTDVPFGLEPYDGTIGLSLEGMSVSPQFNFLNAFFGSQQPKLPNSFSLHLGGEEDGGEISFGGYDVKQLKNPLEWVTVAEPEEGRWQVAITAIRIGNNTLKACRGGDCRAALDYGASLLSVPSKFATGMEQALEALAVPSGYGDGCQTTVMPDLQLVLKNDVILTLPAEDYVSQVSRSGQKDIMSGPARSCKPVLAQHDFHDESLTKDVFVLGESILRRYYTFFDADSMKVGFSLATGSTKAKGSVLPPLLDAGKGKEWLRATDAEEDGNDNGVILLVQVKLRRSKTISSLGV